MKVNTTYKKEREVNQRLWELFLGEEGEPETLGIVFRRGMGVLEKVFGVGIDTIKRKYTS